MPPFTATNLRDSRPDMIDAAYFSRLCAESADADAPQGGGINTLAEKRLHRVLKSYYEADETRHEQKVGSYIADILRENEIVEIQTGGLYPLKDKIAFYLRETDYRVTVVHPIFVRKWILWVDPVDGSLSPRHRSPKKGRLIDEADELIYFADLLPSDRLQFVFPLLEVEDYRLLNGWSHDRKRGSVRCERIPLALLGEEVLREQKDFAALLPDGLPACFTAREFAAECRLTSRQSYTVIKLFCALGLLQPAEPQGRSRTWSIVRNM